MRVKVKDLLTGEYWTQDPCLNSERKEDAAIFDIEKPEDLLELANWFDKNNQVLIPQH